MTWRPAHREERQLALLWAASAVSALLLVPFWRLLVPLLPPCGFRVMTGLPCPTCGTTRAGLALLAGDIPTALACNPGAAVAGLMFLGGGAVAAGWALLRAPMPVLLPGGSRLRVVLIAAFLANWAYLLVAAVP